MIARVSALSGYGKVVNSNQKKNKSVKTNVMFQSSPLKKLRNAGFLITAATLLSAISCNKNNPSSDVVEVKTTTEKNDSMYVSIGEYRYKDNRVHRYYHYFPTDDNCISADEYSWSEAVYPDGRIERDSFNYKISISPDGKRTVVHTEQDEYGHKTVTKESPDGTKVVRINYNTGMPKEILYVQTEYWSDGKIKERNYYNEYPVDKKEPDGETIIEKSVYKYNDKEVLLMWESNEIDSMRSEKFNKYDKKGRLLYDDVKNETYYYKFGSKHPYRAVSEREGCKRIKLLNSDGTIKREYFKAQDGTITEQDVK